MKQLIFAFKQALRPAFLVILAVCMAAIILASLDSAAGTQPPAGICNPGSSLQSQRIVSYLTDNGFVLYEDEQVMYEMVRIGQLDCGAVLPPDLPQRLEQGDLEGCVRFITAPDSFAPELYRSHLTAVLFHEYAPYITAASFAGTEVSREEVLAEYQAMFDGGYAFSFELLTVEGTHIAEDTRSRSLVTGAAALLLCVALLSSCTDLLSRAFRDTLGRLGLKKTLAAVVLPGMGVRALLIAMAGGIALAIAGRTELIAALVVYVLLLAALSLLLAALLPDARYLSILLPIVLILSLALCPIYTDLTLFSPALAAVRCVLPPYWFWLAAERPVLLLVIAVIALPLMGAVLILRYAVPGRYRFKSLS